MAAVYRVRHLQLDSDHALKVLFVTSPVVRDRLLLEGKVQANLRHPNIVSVTDVLDLNNVPALVMEYVDGPSLDNWLEQHRPTLEEALWLFRGILRGVGAAHARGLVHRDLKPANVLLAPSSVGFVPKVTDFGLVKSLIVQESVSHSGVALGTPEYMSPEQIRDPSQVDQRADMWALGCILFELVCGVRAYSADDRISTFEAIISGDRQDARALVPQVPAAIASTIDGLLQVDPARRLPDAEAVVRELYGAETPTPKGPRPIADLTPAPLLVSVTRSKTPGPSRATPEPQLQAAPTGESAMRRTFGPTPPSARATAEFRVPSLPPERTQWVDAAWLPMLSVALLALGLLVGGTLVGMSPQIPGSSLLRGDGGLDAIVAEPEDLSTTP